MSELSWPTGGLWEDVGLMIRFDEPMERLVGYLNDPTPCPHAQDRTRKPTKDGGRDAECETWTVPRALIAHNEAGHATTGVCADCVVDAMQSLRIEAI